MKKKGKFGKFILGSVTLAAAATGIYYLYKNFINRDYTDDFDDFDDEFDDIFADETNEASDEIEREYVSINIGEESKDDSMDVKEVTPTDEEVEDNEDDDILEDDDLEIDEDDNEDDDDSEDDLSNNE